MTHDGANREVILNITSLLASPWERHLKLIIITLSKLGLGELTEVELYHQCITILRVSINTLWYLHNALLIYEMAFKLFHTLVEFSRQQIDDIFPIFPRKLALKFHANCLLRRQFARNVKAYFLGKIREIFGIVIHWIFLPSMLAQYSYILWQI